MLTRMFRAVLNLSLMFAVLLAAGLVPAVPSQAAQSAADTLPSQATQPVPDALPPISSRWACTPPIIDGHAPYHEWGMAPSLTMTNTQIYLLNDASALYVLMDVVGDWHDDPIVTDPPYGDYFFLTFDVDRNGAITFPPWTDVNYGLYPTPPYRIGVSYYEAPHIWSGLQPTGAQLGVGFEGSFGSPPAHRIWEMSIPFSEIGGSQGSTVYAGFRAYSQIPDFMDNLPSNFVNDFSNLVPIQLAEVGRCNLQLGKTVTPATANPGDILTYRIDYNLGEGAYSSVTIQDSIPPGTTYLPGSASPPASLVGGVLTWQLGDLTGPISGFVKFQVMVNRDVCRSQQQAVVNWGSLDAKQPFIHAYTNEVRTGLICRPVEFPGDGPPYAESEITVDPYPLVVGQPTKLCTTVANTSDQPQTLQVEFLLANFGIGLPFQHILVPGNPRVVIVPPHGTTMVCIVWTPTTPGHQCVEVVVADVNKQFPDMVSQRNLDVNEVLVPGQASSFTIPVGNQTGNPINVDMIVRSTCTGWSIGVSPAIFTVPPGGQQNVDVTVTPPGDWTLGSGCTIDIEAWEVDQAGALVRLIGGIRKIDEPRIPLGDPNEPIFAEREIRITPYPLFSGVPTQACVLFTNNTDTPELVTVGFYLANLGIGLPFNLVPSIGGPNPQNVFIPAHTSINVCITFVPTQPGHQCMMVQLEMANGYRTRSYRNLDVAERLTPGQPTEVPIPVGNPTANIANMDLVVENTCPGWTAMVNPAVLWNVGPNSADIRTVILTVVPPAGELLGSNCHIDLKAYIDGVLIGGIRKIDRPPTAPPIDEPHWAEGEISVTPDPPRPGRPAKLCVSLLNPTDVDQVVDVAFAEADFGAGVPFTPLDPAVPDVTIPAHGSTMACIQWTPPPGGTLHRCIRVRLHQDNYQDVFSQRNIDLEPLYIGRLVFNGYVDLPPFTLHNPGPDPAPFFLDLDIVGLTNVRPELFDADTFPPAPVPIGQDFTMPAGADRHFFLRLFHETGKGQAAPPKPGLLGAEHYVDVLPYVNGQPLMMDGIQSAVRYQLEMPRVYVPVVFRRSN